MPLLPFAGGGRRPALGCTMTGHDVLAARQPQLDVRYAEIPAYGHFDTFIGRNAALDVYGSILDFLAK
jgi:hypothetical protein